MTEAYRERLEQGVEYQDWVSDRLYEAGLPIQCYSSRRWQVRVGENRAGVEIKFDGRFRKTGRLYIEVEERPDETAARWAPAGPFRRDNAWLYAIGDFQTVFVFATRHLRAVAGRFEVVETATSKGFLLPVGYAADRLAVRVMEVGGGNGGGNGNAGS